MKLFRGVLEILDDQEIRYALIGATALAIHGVSRSTADVDLLVDDSRVLDPGLGASLRDGGASTRIVRGDPDDPLLGAVRISTPQERTIDIVLIPGGWVRAILEGTTTFAFGEGLPEQRRLAGLPWPPEEERLRTGHRDGTRSLEPTLQVIVMN